MKTENILLLIIGAILLFFAVMAELSIGVSWRLGQFVATSWDHNATLGIISITIIVLSFAAFVFLCINTIVAVNPEFKKKVNFSPVLQPSIFTLLVVSIVLYFIIESSKSFVNLPGYY